MLFYLIFLILTVYYVYSLVRRHKLYYSQLGLSGPLPTPLLANTLHILFRPFCEYEADNFKKYGQTFVDFFLDTNGVIVTSNPKFIKKILVSDFHFFADRLQPKYLLPYVRRATMFQNGLAWRRARKLVTHVFSSGKLKLMFKNFQKPIQNALDNIDELIGENKGDQIDANKLMKSFALDIISTVVFSLHINNFKDDQLQKRIGNIFFVSKLDHLILFMTPRPLAKFLKISPLKKSIVDYFSKMALSIIEKRKKNPDVVYNDFLEMLLKSEAENSAVDRSDAKEIGADKKMTTEEIIGQLFLFFAAGMETISVSLVCLLYELALNQEVQDKLYKELILYYPNDDVSFDELNNSHYLDCVINENLRKNTSLNRVFRRALDDYDFGDGFKIRKGQTMAISIHNLHMDSSYYKDPHRFIPERFENNEILNLHHLYLFLPFIDGPRNCIGNRFALTEIKSLTIKLIKTYRVFATDKTCVPLKKISGTVLNLLKDVTLGFEKRN